MSALQFVGGAWREPQDFEDHLVEVWRFHSVGRDEDARSLLGAIWAWAMDGLRSAQEVRVALRLLDRLGFVTDHAEAWRSLPDELVVYRAESSDEPSRGFCWTLDRSVAEMHAQEHQLKVTVGVVSKASVLAYITYRGEDEIVVRRERVSPYF